MNQKSYMKFLKKKFKIVSPRKRYMITATDKIKNITKEYA